ncbi:MAG: hypothetical protein E6G55_00220 [Actinobacteria bacterium]|nr:MAG: hypothetical protein E6G55_00220 [Actinomycetota bacterium]
MKVLHRRSTKRVAAFTTALATAAFVVQLAAPAAFAAAPANVKSFFPVHGAAAADTQFANDDTGVTQMAVLSDLGDGVDSTAHLTAVSKAGATGPPVVTGATLVQWYWCTAGTVPPVCPNANLIGADTTATSALQTPGYTGGSIDDAWSIAWDIPASLDGLTKDIVVEGCNATPDATFSNCTHDSVPTLLDDSGTGNNPQTSSGEITSPANGSALSDSATLTLTASTSPELTAVGFGFDPNSGAGDDDNAYGSEDVDSFGGSTDSGVYNDLTPNTTTATAKTWSATVPGTDTPNNDEQALTLWSDNGDMNFTGTGGAAPGGVASFVCGAPCTSATVGGLAFDRHYEVLEPGVPGEALQARLKKSSDVTADATCLTGPSSIFAAAASTVNLTGCVFDAFGTAVGSEGVFWSLVNVPATGGGSFTGSPQLVTDTSGHATANVTSTAASGGSSTTITFCIDHDKNAVCDAGATKTATFTITWSAAAVTHARSISLRLKDALVARGRVTVTDGFAACADSVPVKVQRRVSGHWKTVKKTTTSAAGAYRAHLRNKHGRYRSLAPAVIKGTDTCSRAVSPTRRH